MSLANVSIRLRPVALSVMTFTSISAPAWAGGAPKSLAEYARIAGEAGVARMDCDMELDIKRLQALGAPFRLDPDDIGAIDGASAVVAGAMNQALQERQAEGEAYCARALEAYGPSGSVVPGLLTKR